MEPQSNELSSRLLMKMISMHLLKLSVIFLILYWIFQLSGPESFVITMIAGGLLGYVTAQRLENDEITRKKEGYIGRVKHDLGILLDLYIDKFFFGLERKHFLLFFILFWPIGLYSNYFQDPAAYQSSFVENKLIDALILTTVVVFLIPPLMVILVLLFDRNEDDKSANKKSHSQTTKQSSQEKRGLFGMIGNWIASDYRRIQDKASRGYTYECMKCRKIQTYSYSKAFPKCSCGNLMQPR